MPTVKEKTTSGITLRLTAYHNCDDVELFWRVRDSTGEDMRVALFDLEVRLLIDLDPQEFLTSGHGAGFSRLAHQSEDLPMQAMRSLRVRAWGALLVLLPAMLLQGQTKISRKNGFRHH